MGLGACGAGAGSNPSESSTTSSTADISEGVQPDQAAVALLPQTYKDKGELTVAMDLHFPPTTFLAEDNVSRHQGLHRPTEAPAQRLELDLHGEG